ncbi:hypothetical protein Zmor_028241 [Zophobas morio]|uniref:Uncharacterized protein n=1 Tax=Zophobas morio TaxID=2755281 RepID=A0AA38HSC1_9CUCU|nr:hypothetical protein Zmor_028241 [Zophobas morio]
MSSAICQNFVQNAWKKELCSNCFKSKDEHADRPKPKPITLISNDTIAGIIKTNKFKPKRSVCFTKDLSEIIGFGGEDWESDGEDTNDDSESSEDDFVAESEEEESEKELKRITKENTDFNTTSLKYEPAVKKSTQLLLGKPIVDSSGRKQTLMVSVTPFGEDAPPSPKRFIKSISHIPISKSSNKESVPEAKQTSVVLTSYTKNEDEAVSTEEKSLLDEITETLENSKNPIQIMSRKKIQKEIVLAVSKDDSNKENIKEENKSSKVVERKVGLSRTPALKRDQEKPVVYQTSTAKIELNTKNTKLKKNVKADKDEKTDHEPEETPAVQEPLKVVLPPKTVFPQSREQAGEPDGRADPDTVTEPPALPLTPPPLLEGQNSFLHNTPIYEKPKVPSKPATVLIRKPQPAQHPEVKNQILTTFSVEEHKTLLCKQDSTGSERAVNKRRAPKPPEDQTYARNSLNAIKGDSPVVREKEKRERASSCSPKIRDLEEISIPEPAPRKMLSVSTDSLASEEKRKEKTKGRFSLKRFLRMGSSKEGPKVDSLKYEELEGPPLPKPRLVIVHPSELNGARVEVVAKASQDQGDYQNISVQRYSEVPNGHDYENYAVKAQKPPPPPRNIDEMDYKPNLPHPPKSVEILKKQKQFNSSTTNGKKAETVYANIGEVRSAIVPNKPQRTASMREHDALQQKQERKNSNNTYEPINVNSMDNGENVYDYINGGRSSSPESDSSPHKNSPTSKTARLNKRSESSIDVSGDYFKYSNIPRSLSLTYCGSETESEIYSPYSFYGSESEVTEDDHDWIQNGRTHKLRSRKGRSIVHKNLEDNYGAVIVANHEALAQVLENIQQISHIQPALRGLKSLPNLRWTDFSVKSTTQPVTVGCRTFQHAVWNTQHVTLVINTGAVPSSTVALGTYSLSAITEFSDLIPAKFACVDGDDNKYIQATVGVLPWLQISTLQSYSDTLKLKGSQTHEETWKDASFIMLQLVNALKILQAQGIEELALSLNSFILCKEMDKESHVRLCVLQGLGEDLHLKPDCDEYGTLCMCAAKALSLLQPTARITPLIQSLLKNERAVTLTQVKSILEFCLWGPSDVALGSTIRERELALQRWLDLQRATVLHGLVCTRVQLTVYEECHLFFLVRSNARMMCDASLLLESSSMKHGHK